MSHNYGLLKRKMYIVQPILGAHVLYCVKLVYSRTGRAASKQLAALLLSFKLSPAPITVPDPNYMSVDMLPDLVADRCPGEESR